MIKTKISVGWQTSITSWYSVSPNHPFTLITSVLWACLVPTRKLFRGKISQLLICCISMVTLSACDEWYLIWLTVWFIRSFLNPMIVLFFPYILYLYIFKSCWSFLCGVAPQNFNSGAKSLLSPTKAGIIDPCFTKATFISEAVSAKKQQVSAFPLQSPLKQIRALRQKLLFWCCVHPVHGWEVLMSNNTSLLVFLLACTAGFEL